MRGIERPSLSPRQVIGQARFACLDTIVRRGVHCDNWPITWTVDDPLPQSPPGLPTKWINPEDDSVWLILSRRTYADAIHDAMSIRRLCVRS